VDPITAYLEAVVKGRRALWHSILVVPYRKREGESWGEGNSKRNKYQNLDYDKRKQ
jgi:hypothetical protein